MKIKTFEFMINAYCGGGDGRIATDEPGSYNCYCKYHSSKKDPLHIWSPSEIDKEINKFISNLDEVQKVVDIKIENYTSNRHNNARNDTVIAKYTIIYFEA